MQIYHDVREVVPYKYE